jgi:hypothetical protein
MTDKEQMTVSLSFTGMTRQEKGKETPVVLQFEEKTEKKRRRVFFLVSRDKRVTKGKSLSLTMDDEAHQGLLEEKSERFLYVCMCVFLSPSDDDSYVNNLYGVSVCFSSLTLQFNQRNTFQKRKRLICFQESSFIEFDLRREQTSSVSSVKYLFDSGMQCLVCRRCRKKRHL